MATRGGQKRTGILTYHKHQSRGCGYISYLTELAVRAREDLVQVLANHNNFITIR